jgi:N-hydroxyarylamine O-acetyltransferase
VSVDLTAYFARIGYAGPVAPTLETLNGIVRAHVQAIPFENLDVILGRPVRLSAEALEQKLVHQRRGGYGFEQNGLLLEVLGAVGFQAKPLSARVRLDRPRGDVPPRTHVCVRVEIDGRSWLADVGVGALSLTAALQLHATDTQLTPHEPRRIVREGDLWVHQARLGFEWQDVYEFTLEEMPRIDRELANWYTSTHPESRFRQRLIVSRALPDGERVSVVNRELIRRSRQGRSETRLLESHDALVGVLHADFGLEFDPGVQFVCPGISWAD